MKKFSLISTFIVIAALALAACTSTPSIPATGSSGAATSTTAPSGAAASPSVTGTVSATGTTSAGGASASTTSTAPASTGTAAAGAPVSTGTAVPTGTAAAATTSTQPAATGTSAVPVTGAATGTAPATGQTTSTAAAPMVTASATSTSSAGSSANQTTTPSAGTTGTTQANANQAQFLRLSNLMNLTVQTSDQQQVGAVNSVVVARPSASASASANSSTVTTTAPVVRYVVVNLNSMITSQSSGSSSNGAAGSQVIVPWQAFNFSNLAVGQGSNNQTASTSTLTLNQSMTILAAAPRIDVAQAQNGTSSTWESQVSQYWTSQGLSIPATSANAGQTSSLVFIGKQMNGFNVVGANNAILGQVADFLVNVQTGEIAYAVITPQGMNGQSFFVPLSNMTWQVPVGQNSMTTLGNLVINITPSILQNAPSLGSLNNLQITPQLLQQLNQYWQAFQSTPVK